MKYVRTVFCLMTLIPLVAGCSVVMPYESEFSCKGGIGGKCVSLDEAYDDSKRDTDGPLIQSAANTTKAAIERPGNGLTDQEEKAHSSYKQSLFQRLDGLLKEPSTPIVAPPQVMRVLLLPYKGEGNELYMLRYVYFFVDEPRWVLGDSLIETGED